MYATARAAALRCLRCGVETARVEQRRDALAGVEYAGLHRRRTNDLGDFGDRLFMIVDEVDDLTIGRRELRQALSQKRALVCTIASGPSASS